MGALPRNFGALAVAAATRTASGYEVDERGIIRSPGKFEGEPAWAPEFYDAWNEGGADEEEGGDEDGGGGACATFNLTDEDRAKWPGLKGKTRVRLCESEQGFVYSETE